MSEFEGIYNRISHAQKIEDMLHGDFIIVKTPDGFFQFNNGTFAHEEKVTGWKFHLSVDAKDIPRATEMIAETYKKHSAQVFKVVIPECVERITVPDKAGGQLGKTFTLYYLGEPGWPDILQEIENRFHQEEIMPGYPVEDDRHVSGSRYAYYCNDGDLLGRKRIPANMRATLPAEQRYNPLDLPDPFENLKINSAPSLVKGLDAHLVLHELRKKIGKDILAVGARTAPDGLPEYVVCVPNTFSRSGLAGAEIDPSRLRREVCPAGNHEIIVPIGELPPPLRRDVEFFRRISWLNIPVHNPYRIRKGQGVSGYSFEVPSQFDHSILSALGIDGEQVTRGEGSKAGLHRFTVPLEALPESIKKLCPEIPPRQQAYDRPHGFGPSQG